MRFFKSKSLKAALDQYRDVKVGGFSFRIKKIDVFDYMKGSQAVLQSYDVYRNPKATEAQQQKSIEKIKAHYRDVIMAGVVSPKLVRKKEDESDETILVDDLFVFGNVVEELYEKIIAHTYGKKKLDRRSFPGKSW